MVIVVTFAKLNFSQKFADKIFKFFVHLKEKSLNLKVIPALFKISLLKTLKLALNDQKVEIFEPHGQSLTVRTQ